MEGIYGVQAAAMLGAAIAIAVGTMGPAIGQGMIGRKAMDAIGKNPDKANKIRTPMIIAMAAPETLGIFAFIIAGALIFINR